MMIFFFFFFPISLILHHWLVASWAQLYSIKWQQVFRIFLNRFLKTCLLQFIIAIKLKLESTCDEKLLHKKRNPQTTQKKQKKKPFKILRFLRKWMRILWQIFCFLKNVRKMMAKFRVSRVKVSYCIFLCIHSCVGLKHNACTRCT